MDGALTRALESYEVSFALLPLPARSTESKAKPEGRTKSHAARPEPYTTKGAGKGKGKQGRKGTKPFFKVPQAIHAAGGKGATTDGRPICYNYNLEGCSAAAAGAGTLENHEKIDSLSSKASSPVTSCRPTSDRALPEMATSRAPLLSM